MIFPSDGKKRIQCLRIVNNGGKYDDDGNNNMNDDDGICLFVVFLSAY